MRKRRLSLQFLAGSMPADTSAAAMCGRIVIVKRFILVYETGTVFTVALSYLTAPVLHTKPDGTQRAPRPSFDQITV